MLRKPRPALVVTLGVVFAAVTTGVVAAAALKPVPTTIYVAPLPAENVPASQVVGLKVKGMDASARLYSISTDADGMPTAFAVERSHWMGLKSDIVTVSPKDMDYDPARKQLVLASTN